MSSAEQAVAEAVSWVGTPYVHRQSVRGVGCDCIGLVRGVWWALYGDEPCDLPVYSPDWAEVEGGERLLLALGSLMVPVVLDAAVPGDVVVFRMTPGAVAKHAGVLVDGCFRDRRAQVVHAYCGRAVVRGWVWPAWGDKAVAAFRFR